MPSRWAGAITRRRSTAARFWSTRKPTSPARDSGERWPPPKTRRRRVVQFSRTRREACRQYGALRLRRRDRQATVFERRHHALLDALQRHLDFGWPHLRDDLRLECLCIRGKGIAGRPFQASWPLEL